MLKSGNFLTFFAPVKGTPMNYNYKLIMASMLFFASSTIDCSLKKFANTSIFGTYFKDLENSPLSQEELAKKFYERLDQCCADHVGNPFFQDGYSLAAKLIETSVLDKSSWEFHALKKEAQEIANIYVQMSSPNKMDQKATDKVMLFLCGVYAKLRDMCASGEIDKLIQKCNARCGQYAEKWSVSATEGVAIANMQTPEGEAWCDRQYLVMIKEAMSYENLAAGKTNFEDVLSLPLFFLGVAA